MATLLKLSDVSSSHVLKFLTAMCHNKIKSKEKITAFFAV